VNTWLVVQVHFNEHKQNDFVVLLFFVFTPVKLAFKVNFSKGNQSIDLPGSQHMTYAHTFAASSGG